MISAGPNIFDCGGLNSTGHVTYCLDISGSMYLCLDTVKTHLIEHLRSRADDEKRAANLFNLIAFSSEIYPWSNAVTLCNKSSVASAVDWIERLECKTGTNTLDALVKAFEDEQTTSICLLTDDLCDQQPYVLLNRVSQISRGRPVHCIYLSSNRSDPSEHATIEYLHSLASITRGSFRIVTLGRRGLVEKITPIITQDMASTLQLANLSLHAMNTNISSSSSASILSVAAPSVVLASNSMPNFARVDLNRVNVVHNRVVETTTSNSQQRPTHDIAFSPEAGLMLVNRRVLARSKLDGYFYKGKVVNQILAHRFTVEFDVKKNAKDSYKTSDYQDTAIYDIIHFDDAIQHPIRVGDKVLALLDPESERYSPGEVLEGFAKRSSKDSTDITRADVNLIVRFSNGKTRTLTEHESPAIWLPDAAFDRLKFELNLPSNARQYVETLNTDYPLKSLPGYPAQPVKPFALSMPRLAYATWPFYVPYNPAYSVTTLPATTVIAPKETNTREVRVNEPNVDANTVSRELVITDRQEIKTDDLSRKIKEQIKLNEHLLNELEERKCRARSKSAERSCSCHQRQHQHVPVETKHICNSDVKEALYENQYLNKYYESYRQQIHDLYHDCHNLNQHQNYCHCHVRSHSPVESLIRSKSVSFCDSHRDSEHEEDVSLCSYHSKESTASKSKQHKKLVYTNVPNRFGNPKVSVGLPDRPVSSHANLGIKSKSISDLGPATKPLKSNQRVERWEKTHKEQIESEAKKSAARDQYKRTQMQNRSAALEKQELQKPFHINRANIKTPTESSWEAKEEKKIAYMRSQAAKRDMNNMALQREQALKEANKLAYKKSQETKRNQVYHERLMSEEAWRQGEQRQSQLKFERVKLSHEAKENRERQRDELEKSLRHEKYIKMKNNLFY